MEYMIWFIRLLVLFFLVLGVAGYGRDEISIAHSTMSHLKPEPAMKLVLQGYSDRLVRIPQMGEALDGHFEGEEIKLTLTELIPNEKVAWELTHFNHYESLKESYQFTTIENSVLIQARYVLKTKNDPLSRLIFLVFAPSSLKQYDEKVKAMLGPKVVGL